MTNANNKANTSACTVSELVGFVANGKDRTTITFELAEDGRMEETRDSLKRRITAVWGFQTSGIELLEASTTCFKLGGKQFNIYDSVQFSVNGKGWSTDFKTIARDTAYDEKE